MADTITDTLDHVEHLTGDAAVEAGNVKEDAGFRRVPRVSEAQVARAGQMMAAAFDGGITGRRAQLDLLEAFTTSDFQWAAFVVLDRETIAQYQEIQTTSDRWVDTTTVRDFRPKRLTDFTQSGFTLEPVGELAPYPMQDRKGGFEQSISVAKYGRRYALSWESMINDQLDELADLPNALATAAREAEQFKRLSLLLNFNAVTQTGSGPNTGFFKNYTGSFSSTNPFAGVNTTPATVPLTYDNLRAALDAIKQRKNPFNGRPIVLPGRFQLIVPPELEMTARAILAIEYREVTVGGVMTRLGNEVAPMVDLVVEPWLTMLDKGAKAATTWYLLPPTGSNFKALMFAKLRGHETPEMRVRADTGNSVGGGALSPQDGSFDIDDIQYRVRSVFGGTTLNPLATYVSLGS
jgi:hypothetical protein